MRRELVTLASALALVAALAPSADARPSDSTRAVEQGPIVTFGLGWVSAGSPASEANTGVVSRSELRTGSAGPTLYLGTQLGYELTVQLAAAQPEAQSIRDGIPLSVSASLGFSLRTLTFDLPTDGMIVVHAATEAGVGGGMWWSDGPRFAFTAGARLALRPAKSLRLELDYTLVPHVFTSAPHDWSVRRTEHRGTLDVGVGQLDVLLWTIYAETRRETGLVAGFDRFDALELGAGLGWRW